MRGLVVGMMALIGVVTVSGCVTKWAYDEEVEKNEHLISVKTEQDIERDGLHADVIALHKAYTQQSLRTTAMEAVVTQATNELRAIQSRLTTMNQDQAQLRSDVSKISQQATETLQLLRVLNEQRQVDALTLTQLSSKVDAMKTAAATRAARAAAAKDKEVPSEKPESEKSAVEKAMEQQMGMGPRPAAPLAAKPAPAATTRPTTGPIPAVAPVPTPAPAVVSGPTPVPSAAKVLPPSAAMSSTSPAVVPSPVATAESVTPAEPIKKVDEELSPLQRTGQEKAEQKPKQTWREWAREKIFGKSPVQTAAKNSQPAAPPAEKR